MSKNNPLASKIFHYVIITCVFAYWYQRITCEPKKAMTKQFRRRAHYRLQLIVNYPRLNWDIYNMDAKNFFTPSFLCAIEENTEEAFRNIMDEPCPGIFTFDMLHPQFCEKMIREVDNFLRWANDLNIKIMRPNILHEHGAVLHDLGLEPMLQRFRKEYIEPITRVFYGEFGGSTVDSHYAFVVDYGLARDGEVDLHVDDAHLALNICLGYEFSGGQLFFRGVRCDEHITTGCQPEEMLDYCHVPGRAILHTGRHRHGATATTSGRRLNLIIWLKSSRLGKWRRYQNDCSSWCGECIRKKNAEAS